MTPTIVNPRAGFPACIASRATAPGEDRSGGRFEAFVVKTAGQQPSRHLLRKRPLSGWHGRKQAAYPAEGYRQGAAAGPAAPPPAAAPVSGGHQALAGEADTCEEYAAFWASI